MTMPTIQPATQLQRDAVILYLSVGRLRTRRKIESGAVQSDIQPDMLHVSKDILQSSELKAVGQHDSEVRNWVRARALPSPFSKKGLLLLPVRLIEPVMTMLDESQVVRNALIESFMNAYERCKTEAIDKLGSAFDERDYPSAEAVRRTFFFKCQMWELAAPGKLKTVNRELYQRELLKMDNMWAEASRTVTAVLLEELRKMTSHMVERLTPSDDGKPKVFRDSIVNNMTEWMDLFKDRNLTNDAQLVDIVERAKDLINGVDAVTLRDSSSLRTQLATDFTAMTKQLDEAIVAAPLRSIDLDFDAAS